MDAPLSVGQKIRYKYLKNYHYKVENLYGDKKPSICRTEIAYQMTPGRFTEIKWVDWYESPSGVQNGRQMVSKISDDALKLPERLISEFWEVISVGHREETTWIGNPETDDHIETIPYDRWDCKAMLDGVTWQFSVAPGFSCGGFVLLEDLEIT